jgi:hypothetical protein
MTQTFREEYLEFNFSEDWYVMKFDDQPEYVCLAKNGGQRQLPGIKGVDFAGILNETLYLIEAKDFRDHRIENRERLESGELAIELGKKVHSSVACIIGFWRTSPDSDH